VKTLSPELERVEVPAMEGLLQPADRHFIPPDICTRLGLPESGHAGS
jgi:hypothetical protein